MTCSRCEGFMTGIAMEDLYGSNERRGKLGWQCLICGNVTDNEIQFNQSHRHEPRRGTPRPRFGSATAPRPRRHADHTQE
jgi:hypothetical protein